MKINYDEIDEEMRPIIKVLNDKGWKTLYCCQGHWEDYYNRYWCTYILFKNNIKYEWQPKISGYDLRPKNKVRSKMKYQYQDYYDKTRNRAFYWYGDAHKRISREQKDIEHKRMINELNKWACGLPKYNKRIHSC